jgi:hypothetical protein
MNAILVASISKDIRRPPYRTKLREKEVLRELTDLIRENMKKPGIFSELVNICYSCFHCLFYKNELHHLGSAIESNLCKRRKESIKTDKRVIKPF